MNIYRKQPRRAKVYRKIYEKAHGLIPKDETGRSYDIHHIDGDRNNNELSNLIALSITDHYYVHYSQGDWFAAAQLGRRISIPHDTLSSLISMASRKLVNEGKHHLLKRGAAHPSYNPTIYHFVHLDGREEKCTIYDLRTKYSLKGTPLRDMVDRKTGHCSVKGWRLYGSDVPVLGDKPNTSQYDFIHKDGREFSGTYYEFRTTFNLNAGHVSTMIKNPPKSVKGWKIKHNP